MSIKQNILVSNDDGYGAPGVLALMEAISAQHKFWYTLPDRDRSGASQSLTLHRPIKVIRIDSNGIVVEGTPADCVRLAISGLCEFEPDIVVAGINSGANLGTDVLYSGTVAAAMEAVCAGLPGVAFSLNGTRNFNTAAVWALKIINILTSNSLPNDVLFNINIPDVPLSGINGCKLTKLGQRDFVKNLEKTSDPRNKERYWIGLPGEPVSLKSGTDFKAVEDGYVSITPMRVGRDSLNLDLFADIFVSIL